MDIDIEEYIKSLNLEIVCRTCLSESDEMTSLFSEVVIEDSEIEVENYAFLYDIVTNVSAMQVLSDDGLPTLICKKCIEYATTAYKFKVSCERTEALLQTYANKKLDIKQEDNENQKEDTSDEMPEQITIEIKNDETELETISEHVLEEESYEEQEEIYEEQEEIYDAQEENEETEQAILQNVIVNPEVDPENLRLCEDTSTDFEEKLNANNPPESSVAAFVANSEENIRLRQRIAMKKMQTLQNPGGKNQKMYRKSKSYFYPCRLNDKGEKIFSCPVCNKDYKHSTSLTVHMRSHTMEKPYLCNLCGKSFKQFTGLSYHMRGHSGEQPYACKLCDKKYRQSASLKAHMRIHTGQRPFLCSVCGKGFRQAPDLGYHMRTHTKEKPYMCSVCGKRMSMQCHLVQHMRTHTGEKPYTCGECGKSFASTTRLKRHEIIHTGEKPYECNVCGKAFNRASTLRVHELIHSEEKPHICHLCGKGFIQAHCLRNHLNTHSK